MHQFLTCTSLRGTTFALTVLALCALLCSTAARADYNYPENVLSQSISGKWLSDAVTKGLDERAFESATKDMLTDLGKALLGAYSPALSQLLLGGGRDPSELQTKRIIDEVRSSHADLAARSRAMLDEIFVQFRVRVEADVAVANDQLGRWLESSALQERLTTLGVVKTAMDQLTSSERVLRAYLQQDEADPRSRFRRMALIELHITSARLAILASSYYWGYSAIDAQFRRLYGTNYEQLARWVAGLSAGQMQAIGRSTPQLKSVPKQLVDASVALYEGLAEEQIVEAYLDEATSGTYWQHTRFVADPSSFDNPDVIHASASWSAPSVSFAPYSDFFGRITGSTGITDGYRWYYYVNIPPSPGAACLSSPAVDGLIARRYVPWSEETDPAGSTCNRFWIVQLNLRSTGWPNTYLSSFTNYALWFDDPGLIAPLHRRLLLGDLTRAVYGAASLVLDAMYGETYRATRAANSWDEAMSSHGQLVALLAGTNDLNDGVRYEDLQRVEGELTSLDVLPSRIGAKCWADAVKQSLDAASDAQILRSARACDSDGDGIAGTADNCPRLANAEQEDCDSDGLGDACDTDPCDADRDNVPDEDDNCPSSKNSSQTDCDSNGTGDACDVTTEYSGMCMRRSVVNALQSTQNSRCRQLGMPCSTVRLNL